MKGGQIVYFGFYGKFYHYASQRVIQVSWKISWRSESALIPRLNLEPALVTAEKVMEAMQLSGDIVMAGGANTGVKVIHAQRETYNSDYDSVGKHPRHRSEFTIKGFITFSKGEEECMKRDRSTRTKRSISDESDMVRQH
jgi:hypothetical protein